MSPLRQHVIDKMTLQGFTKSTCRAYLYQLTELARYFHRSPDELTERDLQAYVLYLIRERAWSRSSCRQAVHAIHFLFNKVLGRPLNYLQLPYQKKDQKIPDLLYPDEVHSIIQHCTHLKQQSAIALSYATGMRIGEICALRIDDLDGPHNRIKVRQGKGNKDRYVLFPEGVKRQLRCYWQRYRPVDVLFYGLDKHRTYDPKYLRLEVKDAAKRAGISKTVRFHSPRHAFATHQLMAGMPLTRLQLLLGHRQLSTTLVYLQWIAMMEPCQKVSEDLLGPAWCVS
ncbi:integrase [Nitrincola tibetensis]|uniref:Integrase n=1 Tax=Nitrincola tibetensis TaxID=2219697 RepID=A0A364NJC7_9GAMM|nr:site-specific integrase [Nitrincola tibetensis]RAU16995.1 integrase [Nitrincola tibetensis]